MPKAAIISKPQKPELCEILAQLLDWFADRGYECVLDPESAGYLNRRQDAVERPEMPSFNPEICVTLRGDGTLLSAASLSLTPPSVGEPALEASLTVEWEKSIE